MRRMLLAAAMLIAAAIPAPAATTRNDDSCDIAVLPAATLLLPYFEVDVHSPRKTARTTLFTVINTSRYPQIARVTLWTDYSYPALTFNLFLTGYDAQPVNLYDILGDVTPKMPDTSSAVLPGQRSLPNDANPHLSQTAAVDCVSDPAAIPPPLLDEVRSVFTRTRVAVCGTAAVGREHANAIGYATIDVVRTCDAVFPNSPAYYNELLYDNVLTGDYEIIDPNPTAGNFAAGSALVHIRAIPEGGPAGVVTPTNLPYTFYDRYTPRSAPRSDRRQPLPSAFGPRFIQGGIGTLKTDVLIWREGVTGAGAACSAYVQNDMRMNPNEIIRFDEHENVTLNSACRSYPCPQKVVSFPATSSTSTSSDIFPLLSQAGDLGGWIYLNLDNGGSRTYSSQRHSQNWVVTIMYAGGRYAVASDALMLANGCSAAPAPGATIGPGPNVNP